MSLARTRAVVRFELHRTATIPRFAWWAVLTAFPVVIVVLLITAGAPIDDRDVWALIFFWLIPLIACLLGLLLWATPIVQSEIEGSTWTYLAIRPHGKVCVFFGKYITAVGWTALAGWTGLTVSVLAAQPDRALHLWSVLAVLVLLASLSYGALFALIGVAIHKRPMVAAVAYALIFEFLIGSVPAMINQFTVQFRLRTLLFDWIEWQNPQSQQTMSLLVGTGPAWKHVVILLSFTVVLLTVAVWMLREKTFVTDSDS